MTSSRSICKTLHMPAKPAAASEWPKLALTLPTLTFPVASRIAAISIGSPRGVPVPWASTYAGVEACDLQAASRHRLCDNPEGAVKEAVRPSWLVATVCSEPIALACPGSLRSTREAPPSPRTYPSALASNGRDLPVLESMPALPKLMDMAWERSTFAAPTRPRTIDPFCRASSAARSAVRDEEQAVSRVIAGPPKSKVWLSRPDNAAGVLSCSALSPTRLSISRHSIAQLPTYTPTC